MGSMSASDAAPLPRLGEVYFDVRGESRSMRLSWYADTGVAVFSIWQGGTCTGTFRLPIADLPRMVEALQRGPDGDSGRGGEQPAAQGRRGSPAPGPHPVPPHGDIDAGRGDAAAHRARGGRHHGDGRSPAGYGGGPPGELSEEPRTGYGDELDPGYSGGRSARRHGDELTGEYGERPSAAYSGSGYRAEPGDQQPEGRRAGGHRAGPHADEPTGVYRSHDDLSHASGEADDRYRHEPAGAYHDDGMSGSHHDDGRPRSYGGNSPSETYRDDSLPGGHEPEPPRQYPGDRPRSYEPQPTAAYPGGGYDEEPTGVYRGDPLPEGYEDHRGGRYAERDYQRAPLAADYPTGPSALDHPGTGDTRDYPVSSRDPGYLPARPYVNPPSSEAGQPEEAVAHEPRRSRGHRDDEDASDSWLYGQPSSERSARGQAR